ncbi:hypothetical protein ABZ721_04855 [Streptomyces sp. NPDC006733]|uniref:hypothetical protein n=1 Tax=Streptomyces sp. NPDC006733 TaxID=3155460 RepID=UPI0033C59102
MNATPDDGHAGSSDAEEARRAIDTYLRQHSAGEAGRPEAAEDLRQWQETGTTDDRVAECVAREAWDAVQDVTPPPPDSSGGQPERRAGQVEQTEQHDRACRIARGLRELGHHLDETLLPGPGMAAG